MICRMSAVNAQTKLKPVGFSSHLPKTLDRDTVRLPYCSIMELVPKGWNELGVSNIIYEEEEDDDDDSSTIPSLSPDSTASSTPENRRVEAWSLATCREPDVIIHIQDSCFRLHKYRLIARSGYLERQLKEFSKATFSLPLNITAETFSLVTNFCYGARISITPFNVASLLIAARLLDMSETRGPRDENLCQKTENYFRLVVAVNLEYVSIVLRSCFSLLPEVETTACLVSRCIEALSLMGDVEAVTSCLHDVRKLCFEDFQLILKSTNQRLTECHDLLYIIADLYLKEHVVKMTEDQKTELCTYVDCSILSSKILMHAVQNPRMPLRFVVHAIFVEQLNTRRSIISIVDHQDHKHQTEDAVTLGSILKRDAALHRVAELKAVMNSTNSRVHCLEKELSGMRKLLNESEYITNRTDLGRSASFHLSSENKIERGQIGSISSISLHNVTNSVGVGYSSSQVSVDGKTRMNFRQRFVKGLKSAFRVPRLVKKKC